MVILFVTFKMIMNYVHHDHHDHNYQHEDHDHLVVIHKNPQEGPSHHELHTQD